ncbi:hypothetical protein JCM17961_06560 [Endothiovibrio diazotrophicus]
MPRRIDAPARRPAAAAGQVGDLREQITLYSVDTFAIGETTRSVVQPPHFARKPPRVTTQSVVTRTTFGLAHTYR